MKYFFRLLRWPLGQLVIFLDWISGPKPPEHSPEVQQALDAQTAFIACFHLFGIVFKPLQTSDAACVNDFVSAFYTDRSRTDHVAR